MDVSGIGFVEFAIFRVRGGKIYRKPMLRYLLVDEFWTHVGEYESPIPDWSVGQEFYTSDGRCFAIVGIVPNPVEDADYVATWVVERA